ncbi:hypothetical protein KCU81_g195, partial [Aureobasidium melanogenum]
MLQSVWVCMGRYNCSNQVSEETTSNSALSHCRNPPKSQTYHQEPQSAHPSSSSKTMNNPTVSSANAHLAGDEASAKAIMATTSPRKQKQLGRDVQNFDVKAWEKIKLEVVERGNYLKFTQGNNGEGMKMGGKGEPVALKRLLLETGDRELVEASRFDRVWGIGFDAEQAMAVPREEWGQNLLGVALMNVRERIRKESEGRAEGASRTVTQLIPISPSTTQESQPVTDRQRYFRDFSACLMNTTCMQPTIEAFDTGAFDHICNHCAGQRTNDWVGDTR